MDGVYDKDPKKHPEAKIFSNLTYKEVISSQLGVMDLTAITLCSENDIPVVVFNMRKDGNITRAVKGEANIGTIVMDAESD